MCVLSGSVMSNSLTLWNVSYQAPLSIGFSRKEHWSGFPFPTPGDLPDPGIKPSFLASPALSGRFFTTVPTGKPLTHEFFFPINTTQARTVEFADTIMYTEWWWWFSH